MHDAETAAHDRSADATVRQDVGETLALERRHEARLAGGHRLARLLARSYSSIPFVAAHLTLIVGWLLVNSGVLGLPPFDPRPFPLLAVLVSCEVLFLSTFVLIAQNKDRQRIEHQALVALHLNRQMEQKLTALVHLVQELQAAQGLSQEHPLDTALQHETSLTQVADAIDAAHGVDSGRRGQR